MTARNGFTFIGTGDRAALLSRVSEIQPWGGTIGPWRRHHGDDGVEDDNAYPNHPANYRARDGLADAVNTAIALSKPLLLTGLPGTGKSQLAERIAWEFNLGPVLRFEAQSLSEAADLFYRFDLVGHLAAVEMVKLAEKRDTQGELAARLRLENPLAPERFIKLGPLGEAIIRSEPNRYKLLFDSVFGPVESAETTPPRPSVVLIDEIDKASRDFPNDLLNGIERLEFRVRELGLDTMTVQAQCRPIVIVTSNSERDLPAPFLRRCTFFHIEEPKQDELRDIVAQRFFASPGAGKSAQLPPFYNTLVDAFWSFRELHEDNLQYRPGTSELIDWTSALRSRGVNPTADLSGQLEEVQQTASAVSKHKDDQQALRTFLKGLTGSTRQASS
jgi:MoxR-like ATPase